MDLHKPRQFSGQLYKYTNVMRGWQYRYFMVDSNAGLLHYYLCEGEKPDGSVPRGSVHLAGAVVCPSDEDSKTFTVSCASGDMLKLRAADARARQEWVNGLRAVAESHTKVNSCLCSFTNVADNYQINCLGYKCQQSSSSTSRTFGSTRCYGLCSCTITTNRTSRFSFVSSDRICRRQANH